MTDKYSKLRQYNELLNQLRRQYPDYPATFSRCKTERCGTIARGAGLCRGCIEILLSHLVGYESAKRLHDAIKLQATINNDVREMLYDNEK